MAGLNAYGFQVRKSACDTVSWSKNSVDNPKEHQKLPWHLPLKSFPSKKVLPQSKTAQLPSPAQKQQQQQQEEEPSILRKSKCSPTPKNNTITRYFQKAPSVTTSTATEQEQSKRYKEENVIPEYCMVKHRIPFSELWSNIVEDLHYSCSTDSLHDDDLQKIRVLSIRTPRGLRRKTRDDDNSDDEEGGCCGSERGLGRPKMVKLDLVSAFQNILTVSPAVYNVQMMDFECEIDEDDNDVDDGCLERPVKHRMSASEAALLFQHIADELLMY